VLDLDLTLLRTPDRFEQMCFRLARYEFENVMPLAHTWDGGRDLVIFPRADHRGDIVFQCKFIKNLVRAKPSIAASLDQLVKNGRPTAHWILCVPVEPSGIFMNWLQRELEKHQIDGSVWGRSELLARLERHRDVLETFFYPVLAEFARHFRSARLELFKFVLDRRCQWSQPDKKVLSFSQRRNVKSPDLVFDLIVRNIGTVGLALTGIQAEILDRRTKMHGLPGDGLLLPQITYAVSIRGGQAGVHFAECEPPLIVRGGDLERFKVRLKDTGYAWNGGSRISLQTGPLDMLHLPAFRIFT
jgi:hypothetical protein